MNKSDSLKLIYWGTAGCASRAVSNFMTGIYVKDLMFHHNERGWINIFLGEGSHTHQQGIPKGADDSYKIICNTRNPYTMCFSTWTDYNNDDSSLTFEQYLTEIRYRNFDTNPSMDTFYWLEWPKIGRNPDYLVRLEHMEEDLKSIPELANNCSQERWDEIADAVVRFNTYGGERDKDNYTKDNQQKVASYYTQELADLVYSKEKFIFDYVGYDKDSWKLLK